MTAPWLKFRRAEEVPLPAAQAPATTEAGPWQKFAAPVAAEARALRPSDVNHQLASQALGETAATALSYLPPIMMLNTWADAAQADKTQPPAVADGVMTTFENTMRGIGQGTNPNAGAQQQKLGVVTSEDDGGIKWYTDAEGNEQPVTGQVVALRDPQTGQLTAYSRSSETDEGGVVGASRLVAQGLLTGPVTGASRSAGLVGPAAGEVSGGRAAAAADDLAAFDRAGVPVFAPAFAEGPSRGLAKSLSDTPVIGAPLTSALDRSVKATAERADDIAGRFGSSPNPQQAGSTVRDGIERFKDARPADVVEDSIKSLDDQRLSQIILAPTAETSFKTKQGALYERAWRLIPEEMQKGRSVEGQSRFMSAPSETRVVLDEIAARNTRMVNSKGGQVEAPPMAGGQLGRMVEAIRNPRWTANLQTLRDMRSEVRRLASGMADTEKNVLKASDLDRIQSAITRDMVGQLQRNAAKYREAGQVDEAAKIERSITEFQRADQYTRLSIERMDKIERLFRADTGEALARNIANAALGGGRGNIEMLQTLNKTLRPDEMGEVKSMLFSELGRPVASARGVQQETGFSVNSFTTRWNAMSPEAKALLFNGEHAAAIDDFVKVASRLANVDAMGNASRSGIHAVNVGGVLALGGSVMSGSVLPLLGSAAGGYSLSYLLSRPAYARWAAQYMKLKSQTSAAPKAIDAAVLVQMNRLAQMAKSDPQLEPVLRSLTAEDGVIKGGEEQQRQDKRRGAEENSDSRQQGELGGSPHNGSVSSGGLMINPMGIAGAIKGEWDATRQPIREETRGNVAPLAQYEDGSYHLAVPEITGLPAFNRMRDLGSDGDPEQLAKESLAAAGGAAAGGVTATAAGKGVPAGAVGAFGGRLFGRAGPEAELANVAKEIAALAPRYRELFGKDFVAPKARPGTPAAEALKGELQTLEELRTAVRTKESALASLPEQPTTPRIADRTAERDDMLQQSREHPYATVQGPGGKFVSKKEELKAINREFDAGGRAPERPWGRGPDDYRAVVRADAERQAAEAQQKFKETRSEIARLKDEKDAAEAKGMKAEVEKLRAELKAANKRAVEWQQRANEALRLLSKKDGLDD